MGKGNYVLHTIKLKANDLRGLCNHNERKTENSSNPDIQRDLTELNYELHRVNSDEINYEKDVKALISERYEGRKLRENTTFAVSFNISSGKEFFEGMSAEEEKRFFQANYELVAEKYGKENIISARVHKDEETPHMHLVLVPFTKDNRLSAKELFDRGNLRELQDFALKLQDKGFDIERGLDSEGRNKHIETKKFKEIEKLHEVALIENIVFDKEKEVQKIKESLEKIDLQKGELEDIKKFPLILENIKKNKTLLGKNTVEPSEINGLEKILGSVSKHHKLLDFAKKLDQENKDLKENLKIVKDKIETYKQESIDLPKIKTENEKLYMAFDKAMNELYSNTYPDMKKFENSYFKAIKSATYSFSEEEKTKFLGKIEKSINGYPVQKLQNSLVQNQIKSRSNGYERD